MERFGSIARVFVCGALVVTEMHIKVPLPIDYCFGIARTPSRMLNIGSQIMSYSVSLLFNDDIIYVCSISLLHGEDGKVLNECKIIYKLTFLMNVDPKIM